ncbi:hypothetical protein FRACYDRAFT_234848 [Fragilariopsis cylindrus CCMP1102]|uniref:Uncharacterized protein n=1 Tax=Fragilariopsis cylindrus CCMP1102 TaxID=635003 RepID=A0A1E7FSR4_9STRA|nr:hypothetical protein FRACYDRAFT_234848 [Fragilariopsis cylindrus CCMP1102]|eukprot:OEU21222.1 hypothetical protein FRACYDRAFT_234848 [Fragilariopsis cylindrus CCMP1102]
MRMARGIKATASNRRRESSSLPLLLRVGVATVVGGIVLLVVLQCILYDHLVINDEISSINNNNNPINEKATEGDEIISVDTVVRRGRRKAEEIIDVVISDNNDGSTSRSSRSSSNSGVNIFNNNDSNNNDYIIAAKQTIINEQHSRKIQREKRNNKQQQQQQQIQRQVQQQEQDGNGKDSNINSQLLLQQVLSAHNNNPKIRRKHHKFCDNDISFREKCDLQQANCIKHVNASSTHGIGNAIICSFERTAEEVFNANNNHNLTAQKNNNQNCAPAIHSTSIRNNEFDFLKHNRIPNVTTTNHLCTVYAITQPKEIDNDDPYHYDQAVTTERRSLADDILVPLRKRANTKFGKKKWRLYVASDAPGIKLVIANYLSGEYYKNALMTTGSIGHNHDGVTSRTTKENEEVETNVFVDLIMMSESSLFTFIGSKFPQVAAKRSMCEQEILPAGGSGMPRHTLVGLRNWLETITKLLTNVNHPPPNCLSSLDASLDIDHPVEQCLCWVKRAHAGVSVSVDVDVDVGVDGQ